MKQAIGFIIVILSCVSFTSDLQKKILRQDNFDIECYVSVKAVKSFDYNKTYYWFKSGEIHTSVSSAGGFVLHSDYAKFYRSNQLAEQGKFNYGLKHGAWKDWYENGKLKLVAHWKNGFKHGEYMTYDSLGTLNEKGYYKNNYKTGQWVNHVDKDTTYYKNSTTFKEKPKSFLQRVFIGKDSLEKKQIKLEKAEKRRKDSIKRASKPDGFFKRLFKKKNEGEGLSSKNKT